MWRTVQPCHKGSFVNLPIPFFLLDRNERWCQSEWNGFDLSQIFTYKRSQAKMEKDSFVKKAWKWIKWRLVWGRTIRNCQLHHRVNLRFLPASMRLLLGFLSASPYGEQTLCMLGREWEQVTWNILCVLHNTDLASCLFYSICLSFLFHLIISPMKITSLVLFCAWKDAADNFKLFPFPIVFFPWEKSVGVEIYSVTLVICNHPPARICLINSTFLLRTQLEIVFSFLA